MCFSNTLAAAVHLTIIFKLIAPGIALDIAGAMQSDNIPCFVPEKTAQVNGSWVTSVDKWYFPHMGILDLYFQTLVMLGMNATEFLSEADLYYDACITYDLGGHHTDFGYWSAKGFGNRTVHYRDHAVDGIRTFDWWSQNGYIKHSGATYNILTDNKSYLFSINLSTEENDVECIIRSEKASAQNSQQNHVDCCFNGIYG